MKHNRPFAKVLFVILSTLVVLACEAASLGAASADTPVPPTNPPPTVTPTSPPLTVTPIPKPTNTPEPPTPAPMGETVQSANFEVKVLAVENRPRVFMGGNYSFTPISGYLIVDVGVKVSNISGSSLDVAWGDVYLMNVDGEWVYPAFATFKDTNEDITDTLAIGISDVQIDPETIISVKNKGYLRLLFHVVKGDVYYFGFSDSPLTEVHFK